MYGNNVFVEVRLARNAIALEAYVEAQKNQDQEQGEGRLQLLPAIRLNICSRDDVV